MDGFKPRHTTLLLGRLGLEPCCTREEVEMRWLQMVNTAREKGVQIDSITQECYQLLHDESRWAGKPQGRKKNDVDENVKVFLLENNLYGVMESSSVRKGLTGVTLETLSFMSALALQTIGFSVKQRLQLDLAFGRLESKDQALSLLLQEAGLSSFVDAFRWHQIDIHSVGMLTQEDLDEIGLTDPLFLSKFNAVIRPAQPEVADQEDEDLAIEPGEYPVLRMIEGLSAEQELDNARAMIKDLHMERVDIVSRVSHGLVLEKLESQRLRDQVQQMQHAMASAHEEIGNTPPEGIDTCVNSLLSALLALPGGHPAVAGRAEESVAQVCARTLDSLAQQDALKAWRDEILAHNAEDGSFGLMGKLRRAVALILRDQVPKENDQQQRIEALADMFDEERAVTLKLLHVTKQHEAEVAALHEQLERERAQYKEEMHSMAALVSEKDEEYRVLKMEIRVMGKTLEESRRKQVEERNREMARLWQERDAEVLKLHGRMEQERDVELLKLRGKMQELMHQEQQGLRNALADKDKQIEELAEMYLNLETEMEALKAQKLR